MQMKSTFKHYLIEQETDPAKLGRLTAGGSKSIPHVEDLNALKLSDFITNPKAYQIQEKIDGTALRFGIDLGELYTSRGGKGSDEKIFDPADWGTSGAANVYRSAHNALEANEQSIKKILNDGDEIDLEILYGDQPNVIIYGKDNLSYIVFLRDVHDQDQSKVSALAKNLAGITTTVQHKELTTDSGTDLKEVNKQINYGFLEAPLKNEDPSQLQSFKDLEAFFNDKSGIKELTNKEVITAKDDQKQQQINARVKDINRIVTEQYMAPLKQDLLKLLVTGKVSTLCNVEKSKQQHAYTGIEGVVMFNPKNMNAFKVVDRDTFTEVNKFYHRTRDEIRGQVLTTDPVADQDRKGGIYGMAMIRIAQLFNITGFDQPRQQKRILAKFKGVDVKDTINNIAGSLKNVSVFSFKKKISAIIESTIENVEKALDDFKKESPTYQLKLKDGQVIKYTDEVVHRTLLVFAETLKILNELKSRMSKVGSISELVSALYHNKITALFDTPPEDSTTEKSNE